MKYFIKILVVLGLCMGSVSASVQVLRRSSTLSETDVSRSYRFLQGSLRLSHNKEMSNALCRIFALLFNGRNEAALNLLQPKTALNALSDEEVAYLVRYACNKTNIPSVVTQLCTFPRVTSQMSHVYLALKNAARLNDHDRMLVCCEMLVKCFCKGYGDAATAKRWFDNELQYAFSYASEDGKKVLKKFQESIDWEASFEKYSQ